mgnify:CR=1 FL=1
MKLLQATEIKNKKERYKLSQMKILMAAVEIGAEQLGIWQDQRGSWGVGYTVWLYESVNHLFKYPSKTSKICWDEQISWQTVFNLYKSYAEGLQWR